MDKTPARAISQPVPASAQIPEKQGPVGRTDAYNQTVIVVFANTGYY